MKDTENEIVLYQPDETISLDVRLENETVWLTQSQIALLFGTQRPSVTKHLSNIYSSGELEEKDTCSILEHMGNDGKQRYVTKYYNLDAILSVGYRVNSKNAVQFRRWATSVLKDYLLKGYAFNNRMNVIEKRLNEQDLQLERIGKKVVFFVKTSLPPVEGVFFDGEIFDAYVFVCDLVKRAKQSIVLIDNYIDETVLSLLDKRAKGVTAIVYTASVGSQLQLDIARHNAQYAPVDVRVYGKAHDRFLCIDDVVYHVGASIKDLGKKWFAFSKMEHINARELLARVC